MIDYSVGLISDYDRVRDAAISVKDNYVYMVVIADYSTSKDYAQDLADSFIRSLGSIAAQHNQNLTRPSKDSFGSLFDHYNIDVQVATPGKDVIARGVKGTLAKQIRW